MECIALGVVWIICAAAGSAICEGKGRSAFEGFLLGLLFGPIGLIICAVLPKDVRTLEQRALRSGAMRKCPHCAELVRPEAKVCRYCGRELRASDFVQQGIVALKAGRRSDARELFRCAIERDADSEDAWGWLGKAADTDKERERCLQSVLSINPENITAQRELELLRERKGERVKMSPSQGIPLALAGVGGVALMLFVLFLIWYLAR